VVQVEMPPGQLPRQLAYIDVGLGTVRFELIGPPGIHLSRDSLSSIL